MISYVSTGADIAVWRPRVSTNTGPSAGNVITFFIFDFLIFTCRVKPSWKHFFTGFKFQGVYTSATRFQADTFNESLANACRGEFQA